MSEIYHIIPLRDMRSHSMSLECWCKPELDQEGLEDVYVHNALDEREKFESGERKPS